MFLWHCAHAIPRLPWSCPEDDQKSKTVSSTGISCIFIPQQRMRGGLILRIASAYLAGGH